MEDSALPTGGDDHAGYGGGDGSWACVGCVQAVHTVQTAGRRGDYVHINTLFGVSHTIHNFFADRFLSSCKNEEKLFLKQKRKRPPRKTPIFIS